MNRETALLSIPIAHFQEQWNTVCLEIEMFPFIIQSEESLKRITLEDSFPAVSAQISHERDDFQALAEIYETFRSAHSFLGSLRN